MAEEKAGAKWPTWIPWSVIAGGFTLVVGGTWWQRGAVAELDSLRATTVAVSQEQSVLRAELRSANARMATLEAAINEQKVDLRWIQEALRRQEFRSGYTPPPAPSAH